MAIELLLDSSSIINLLLSSKEVEFDKIATIDLAYYEVSSALRKLALIKKISGDQAMEHLQTLITAPFAHTFSLSEIPIIDVLQYSLKTHSSLYDSVYAYCALTSSLTLVTEDIKLKNAVGTSIKTLSIRDI